MQTLVIISRTRFAAREGKWLTVDNCYVDLHLALHALSGVSRDKGVLAE
jgi:hypothetical protein